MFLLLPFATDCERERFPAVTVILMLVNTAVWFLQVMAPEDRVFSLTFLPSDPSLLGAIMSMFMHEWQSRIPLHLAGNMLFLWVFGSALEDRMGPGLFALLYLAGGIAADLLHLLVAFTFSQGDMDTPMLGASGAVMAVVGMFAPRFYRNQVQVFWLVWLCIFIRIGVVSVGALWMVGYYIIQDFVFGLLTLGASEGSGVAHWAHVGGFLFGGGVALALGLQREASTEYLMYDTDSRTIHEGSREFAQIEALVRRQPGNTEAAMRLAEAYQTAQRWDEADQIWLSVLQRLTRTGPPGALTDAVQRAPVARIHAQLAATEQYQIALSLEKIGEFRDALEWLRLVASRDEAGDTAELALLRQATIYRDQLQDPQAAAPIFRAFVEKYPYSQWVEMARAGAQRG